MVQAVIEARTAAVAGHREHSPPIEPDRRHARVLLVALQRTAHRTVPLSISSTPQVAKRRRGRDTGRQPEKAQARRGWLRAYLATSLLALRAVGL
jgi:hypothetical protein